MLIHAGASLDITDNVDQVVIREHLVSKSPSSLSLSHTHRHTPTHSHMHTVYSTIIVFSIRIHCCTVQVVTSAKGYDKVVQLLIAAGANKDMQNVEC